MARILPLLALLAQAAFTQTLFLVDSATGTLHAVDAATGAATTLGSTQPLATPCGLAHDGTSLFALDEGTGGGLTGGFWRLDEATGAPTAVGPTSLTGWQDITWDPFTASFFAVDQNDMLYQVSTSGAVTLVGPTPAQHLLTALAIDDAGDLWAMDSLGGGALGLLDKFTATFTVVLAPTLGGFQAMAFHPYSSVLYASNASTDSLYTININTGVVTLVGAHGNGVVSGKGLVFDSCPLPEYEVNSPASSLTIDGAVGSGCVPGVTTKPVNSSGIAAFASTNVGTGWEAVIVDSQLYALSGGGTPTLGGQILNINLGASVVFYFVGAGVPNFSNPWIAGFNLPFNCPPVPGTFSIQLVNLDPTHADGFALSQGCQLDVF